MRIAKEYIYIFLVGLLVGMAAFWIPIGSNHWTLLSHVISSERTALQLLTEPLILSYPTYLYMYRPLEAFLYGSLYNSIGVSSLAYHLIMSLSTAFLGLAVFQFFRLHNRKRLGAAAAVLSMLAPPVLVATWFIAVIDVASSALLIFSLNAFVLLGRHNRADRRSAKGIAVFTLLCILTIISKEPARLFLLLLLGAYYLLSWLYKRESVAQLYGLFIALPLVYIFSIPMLRLELPEWYKAALRTSTISYKFLHNFVQFAYPMFSAGIALLAVTSVPGFLRNREAAVWLSALAGLGFIVLMIMAPFPVEYSFFGMVFFSEPSITYFFSILLVAVLAAKLLKGDFLERFSSAAALGILFMTIAATIFVSFSREDVATRVFIPAMPFVFFILAKSANDFWKFAEKERFLKAIAVVLAVAFAYYLCATMFNFLGEAGARFTAEDQAKAELLNMELSNATVFFPDPTYPLYETDAEYYNKGWGYNTEFQFLNPNKASESTEDMREEICYRTNSREQPYERVYFYIERFRPELETEEQYRMLQGDFEWTANNTFRMMEKSFPTYFWVSEYGLADSYQRLMFSNETTLERFLSGREPLVEKEFAYYQVPKWLDGLAYRADLPYAIKYVFSARVYNISRGELNCTNWYQLETYGNSSFVRASQNATISANNPESSASFAKLRLVGSSFHEPRNLTVVVNGAEQGTYRFSEAWLDTEVTTDFFPLGPGLNTIKLYSPEGCARPSDLFTGMDYDRRCIAFAFSEVELLDIPRILEEGFLLDENWYREESLEELKFRWASQDAAISMYNPSNQTQRAKLRFSAWSFNKTRTLQPVLNGKPLAGNEIQPDRTAEVFTPYLELEPGENKLVFHSLQGCEVPASIGAWQDDTRCLSFGFMGMQLLRMDELSDRTVFEQGWYPIGNFRWMGESAEMSFYNTRGERSIFLVLDALSYGRPRTLQIYVNGEPADSKRLDLDGVYFETTSELRLKEGENSITLVSREGCDQSGTACLGLGFGNVIALDYEQSYGRPLYEEGWHSRERHDNITYRWGAANSSLLLYSQNESKARLLFVMRSFHSPRTLDIHVNGRLLESIYINMTEPAMEVVTQPFQLSAGRNRVELVSREGCETPAETGEWAEDRRCLSFNYFQIERMQE